MKIQGERVNYIDVEGSTRRIFGESQHKKRVQSLACAASGVISSSSLIVHRIGQGLAKLMDLLPKHAVKLPPAKPEAYWVTPSKGSNCAQSALYSKL